MDFATQTASTYPVSDLVNLLNRGFEDYFIPIHFTPSMFVNMLHKDGIDLAASRVLLVDGESCGIALIARRGALRVSRLAAMGIAREMRSKGAGSWFMQKLIVDACDRKDHEMVLEVIEQNEPAVRLYRNEGFAPVRRLVGYICKRESSDEAEGNLYEIELREMSELISRFGVTALPWQLSGESLMQMNPPVHAYRSGQAYVVLSNPQVEHVVLWSLLVEPEARRGGLGVAMLTRMLATYPKKTWHVPALCPEEFGRVFERAGFEKESLSQWQMVLRL